ncbi:MAG: RagB/SusD family nutrient uptake outer membrane protein [Paludibacteraceae bacterium]|nr:RagB/SusD family nutrient uptake outer membrane protein [Paludibacteraceae bacterium]
MKAKYFIISVMSALALVSCKDYLDAEYKGGSQSNSQVQTTVGAVPTRINAAVSGMYSKLGTPNAYWGTVNDRDDDLGFTTITLSLDLNSGDMVNPVSGYDWFSPALEFSDRTPNYANPRARSGLLYNVIYSANEVIASIDSTTEDSELKAKLGQAKAMRAFCYLNMVPYFQFKYVGHEDAPTVPIMADEKTELDPLNNERAPMSKIYDYMLTDLTDAINLLDGFTRSNKGVIDQQVAYGIRARLYLNMEKWAEAAADAAKAMSGYTPYSADELSAPGFYEANDHNWIWALLIPASLAGESAATWPSQLGSFSATGYTAYAGIYRQINSLLYAKIPDTDVRKGWWLNERKTSPLLEGLVWTDVAENIDYVGQDIVDAAIKDVKVAMPAYTNVKFGQKSGVGSNYNEGDWCMMRAEEMILIQAEATAKAGDLATGKTILEDFVKNYRNPQYVCRAAGVDAFSDEVWLQRRIELWGEGFAMADKMRLGKNIVRYHAGDAGTNVPEAYQFNVSSSDPWLLMRFTQTELNGNAGCEQNVGGNQPKQGDGASLKDGVTD